nr:jouberin-like isoform X1 [Nomia melanderi]
MELISQNVFSRSKKKLHQNERNSCVINNSKSYSKNNDIDNSFENSNSINETISTRNTEKSMKIFDASESHRFDNTGSTDLEEFAAKSMNVVVDIHREYKSEKHNENTRKIETQDEMNVSAKQSQELRIFSKVNASRGRKNEYQKLNQVKSQDILKEHGDIEVINSIDLIEEFNGSSTMQKDKRTERELIKNKGNQFAFVDGKSRCRGKWGALQSRPEEARKPPRKRWSKNTSVIRLPEARGSSWASSTDYKFPLERTPEEIKQKSFPEYDNTAFVSDNEEILRIETDYDDRENAKIEMKELTNQELENSMVSSREREISDATVITIENLDEPEDSSFEKDSSHNKSRNNVTLENKRNHDSVSKIFDENNDNESDDSIESQTLEDITVQSNYRSSEESLIKDQRSAKKKNKGTKKRPSIDSLGHSSQSAVSAIEYNDAETRSSKSEDDRESRNETKERKISKSVSSFVRNSSCSNVTKEGSKRKKKKKKGTKYISITIHRADMLEIDYLTKHPMVKVHIVHAETGKYLKSEFGTYLQPMITGKFDFKENKSIVPSWEEEIVFEYNFDSILKTDNDQVVILFEIIDLLSFAEASFNYDKFGHEGCWYKIAWAFLKPVGRNNVIHIDKKVRLQLYKPRKSLKKFERFHACEAYMWWKLNIREKYPSSLFVTVTSIDPPKLEPVLYQQLSLNDLSLSDTRSESHKVSSHASNSIDLPKWSRLSAQSCKIPNEITFETEISENGCFFVAFSNNGKYLACTHSEEHDYPVVVYEVETKKSHIRFSGHKTFIYSLNWSENDTYLLSVSSDQTARIWDVQNRIVQHAEMMPHPSYVYCGKFDPESAVIVATGCYDRTVRIWARDRRSKNRDLCQELEGHEGFINSMCFQKNSNLLTADSVGIIILWMAKKGRRRITRKEWHISRRIKVRDIDGVIINTILLHPLQSRLLVHSRNNGLRMLDLATGVVLQKYNELSSQRIQSTACISPCGGLILCGGEDSTLNIWNLETGTLLAKYTFDRNLRAVTCVDYHPYDHMLAFSTFGSPAAVKILKFNRDTTGEDIGLRMLEDNRVKTNVSDMSLRVLNTPMVSKHRSRSNNRMQTPENALKEKNVQSDSSGKLCTVESLHKIPTGRNAKYTNAKLKLLRLNETEQTLKSRSANRLYNIIEKIDRILSNTSRSPGDIETGSNFQYTRDTSKDGIFTVQNENMEKREMKTEGEKSFAYLSADDHSHSCFESSTTSSMKPMGNIVELKPVGKTRDLNTKKRSQSAKILKSNEVYEDDVSKTFSDSAANYQKNRAKSRKNMESSFINPIRDRKPKEFLKQTSSNDDYSNSSQSAGTYVIGKNDAEGNSDEGSIKLLGNEVLTENGTENNLKDIHPGSDSSVISNATFTIENEMPIPLPRRKKNLS